MSDKKFEFVDEGVIVTIPQQLSSKEIYVEKKALGNLINYPSRNPNFHPFRLVINIAFFEKGNPNTYLRNLNPKVKIRIRYNKSDKQKANKKPKKLAWWDGNDWVLLKSKNTSSPSKKWEGYGDLDTPGWDDPPIAWGK